MQYKHFGAEAPISATGKLDDALAASVTRTSAVIVMTSGMHFNYLHHSALWDDEYTNVYFWYYQK